MIQRLAIATALILAFAAFALLIALADLMDQRLKRLEQAPAAVEEGVKRA